MKKLISFVVTLMLVLFSFTGVASAYSGNGYTVDVPDSYIEQAEGAFISIYDSSENFNVKVNSFSGSASKIYTDEGLDAFIQELESGLDNYREDMRKEIIAMYGDALTSDEIDEFLDNFGIESIITKEITECTRNNYKCFHIIGNYVIGDYGYVCETFSVASDNGVVYTLTLSASDLATLNSDDLRSVVDSFTIDDYVAPIDANISDSFENIILGGFVLIAIIAVVVIVVSKSRKKKQMNNMQPNMQYPMQPNVNGFNNGYNNGYNNGTNNANGAYNNGYNNNGYNNGANNANGGYNNGYNNNGYNNGANNANGGYNNGYNNNGYNNGTNNANGAYNNGYNNNGYNNGANNANGGYNNNGYNNADNNNGNNNYQ